MDLVLVGLSGSGKSAVGRRLAHRHGATFIDLDESVERLVGSPVATIFATEGEASFRRYERQAVMNLGPADPDPELRRVIATGGGAVIDPRNRWLLYRGRLPVWLDGAPEILASRLGRSANVRPLIAGSHPLETLRRQAAERRRFYAPALQLSGTASVEGIVKAVESRIGDGSSSAVTMLRADTPIGRIEIGQGMAATAVAAALTRGEARRAILISEPRAWELAGAGIAAQIEAEGWPVECVMMPRGENAKRLSVIEETCRALARLRVDRRETLVAIGGGALTDAAGFVAATYLRGVPVVQVPTTLVGQIDAAIGGKTAVDLPEGKNLVGAFHQPAAFIADVGLLATLPLRQRRAALGEVVKMAVVGDERLMELVEQEGDAFVRGSNAPFESGAVAEMVERCVWAKVEVVVADERESDRRMVLNLGHTIGHGIEAAAGYKTILHGEAVAYGLRGALAIARAMEMTSAARADRVDALLDRLGLAVARPEVSPEVVREHMAADKKHARGRLNWVLPTESGVAIRSDVPHEAVAAGLAAALRLSTAPAGEEASSRS
jgi:shikimate kinase/3-dehydroquinate synthase